MYFINFQGQRSKVKVVSIWEVLMGLIFFALHLFSDFVPPQMVVHYQLQHNLYLYAPKYIFLKLNSRTFSFWPVCVCLSVRGVTIHRSIDTVRYFCSVLCSIQNSKFRFGQKKKRTGST